MRRTLLAAFVTACATACGREESPVTPPIVDWIDAVVVSGKVVDQHGTALPSALVGLKFYRGGCAGAIYSGHNTTTDQTGAYRGPIYFLGDITGCITVVASVSNGGVRFQDSVRVNPVAFVFDEVQDSLTVDVVIRR